MEYNDSEIKYGKIKNKQSNIKPAENNRKKETGAANVKPVAFQYQNFRKTAPVKTPIFVGRQSGYKNV